MYRDRSIWAYIPPAVWKPGGKAAIVRIRQSVGKQTACWYVIKDRQSGALVGEIAIFGIDWAERTAELGYHITRTQWGKGYASEAGDRVCRVAFRALRLRRLDAVVGEGNDASIRLLKKLGFRREGSARKAAWLRGRWRNQFRFGLLAPEYRPG